MQDFRCTCNEERGSAEEGYFDFERPLVMPDGENTVEAVAALQGGRNRQHPVPPKRGCVASVDEYIRIKEQQEYIWAKKKHDVGAPQRCTSSQG